MEHTQFLNVTLLEPRLKHPTIFNHFDSLVAGESFVIHNDHDPKPLYYQLLAERGQTFSWQYLKNGPEVWEVQIGKIAPEDAQTIGEMVAADYRKAEVFKKFGLDFCCGGKKTVEKACAEKGLNASQVKKELQEVDSMTDNTSENFNEWDPGFLADYVVNKHHQYVRKNIPLLLEFTQKVARVHGEKRPQEIEIANLFIAIARELTNHMIKEEQVLFPFIKVLAEAKKTGIQPALPQFGKVDNPVSMMEHEHEEVGQLFEKVKELSANYTPEENACATSKVTYAKLKEFQDDLFQHIHLENNIMFPKALQLEREIFS